MLVTVVTNLKSFSEDPYKYLHVLTISLWLGSGFLTLPLLQEFSVDRTVEQVIEADSLVTGLALVQTG